MQLDPFIIQVRVNFILYSNLFMIARRLCTFFLLGVLVGVFLNNSLDFLLSLLDVRVTHILHFSFFVIVTEV